MECTQHKKQWISVYHKVQPKGHFYLLFASKHHQCNRVVPKSLTLNGFADGHLIRMSFKPVIPMGNGSFVHTDEDDTITIMGKSMLDIKLWMDAVKHKLNESKTEFIYFGGRQQLSKTHKDTININEEIIKHTNTIKYLGGHLDSSLTFKDHIIAKSKAANHPSSITLGLLQLSVIRITGLQHKHASESPKQCHKISTR